jgi:hypothetical protein
MGIQMVPYSDAWFIASKWSDFGPVIKWWDLFWQTSCFSRSKSEHFCSVWNGYHLVCRPVHFEVGYQMPGSKAKWAN